MTDREIYMQVRREALDGNASFANQVVDNVLRQLVLMRGDHFTVEGACEDLQALSELADVWRDELRKAKAEAKA